MLDIKQIESSFPEDLRPYKRNLLREYLQYKILEIVFDSEFGAKLFFMGGTALHIIHSNTRFSEDLDFDNLGLDHKDFEQLTETIKKKLELEGCNVEIQNVMKGAYQSYIRIPDILFLNGLSRHREEKMLIQIDMEPQGVSYRPDKVILNKFDVFLRINVVSVDLMLSQKIFAIFDRRRPMGRDFYDVVFLFSMTKPNLGYLEAKVDIKGLKALKKKLLLRCKDLDFRQLARDVEPFLYHSKDSKKVLFFQDYIRGLKFEEK